MKQLLLTTVLAVLFNILLLLIIVDKQKEFDNVLEQKNQEIAELNEIIEYRNSDILELKLHLREMEQKLDEEEAKVSRGEEVHRTLTVQMTSYTAFCPEGCIGVTRTGYDVSKTIYYKGHRIVAVDPNVIPLYSFLKIETEKETFYAYALDTGGAIKGSIIDLLVETEEIARQNGRQKNVKVTILREGKGESK